MEDFYQTTKQITKWLVALNSNKNNSMLLCFQIRELLKETCILHAATFLLLHHKTEYVKSFGLNLLFGINKILLMAKKSKINIFIFYLKKVFTLCTVFAAICSILFLVLLKYGELVIFSSLWICDQEKSDRGA